MAVWYGHGGLKHGSAPEFHGIIPDVRFDWLFNDSSFILSAE